MGAFIFVNCFARFMTQKLYSYRGTIVKRKLNIIVPAVEYIDMPSEEFEILIADLRAWADVEYGRRSKLARILGVSRQRVTDWLAGRKAPTLEQGLRLQAFLKKQRRSRG
jgi:hypothetical protein